jgi:HEAT repeat protein
MRETSFRCAKCGQWYTLGRDAQVATSAGFLGDAGAFLAFGAGSSPADNRADPDYVAPVQWSDLSPEGARRQEEEAGRLSQVLATGQKRWWKCKKCGEVQIYKLEKAPGQSAPTAKQKPIQQRKVEPSKATAASRSTPSPRRRVEPPRAAPRETEDDREVMQLIKTLRDTRLISADARKAAAEALGEKGDARAISPLIEALKDSNILVRDKAEEALGKIEGGSAVGPLVEILREKRSFLRQLFSDTRGRAVRLLREMGDASAVEPLIEMLKDEGDFVGRALAAELLGRIGDPRAIDPLAEALTKSRGAKYAGVRKKAAEALGRIEDDRAREALSHALESEDMGVLTAVIGVLAERGGGSAANSLTQLLDHNYSAVRLQAAQALGEIGEEKAVEALEPVTQDKDPFVRKAARDAIDRIRTRPSAQDARVQDGGEAVAGESPAAAGATEADAQPGAPPIPEPAGTAPASKQRSAQEEEPFSMSVRDAFVMKGHLVVTGVIGSGVVRNGDEVELVGAGKRVRTTVAGLQMWGKELAIARTGEEVGVILQGLDRDQVQAGMVVQSPGVSIPTAEVSEKRGGELEFMPQKVGVIEVSKLRERGFAVSPDGSLVALIKNDDATVRAVVQNNEGMIHVVSPSGDAVRELIVPEYYYSRTPRLKFSPDGRRLVALYGTKKEMCYAIYDLESWEMVLGGYLGPTDRVNDFDVSPDGKWLALATRHTENHVFIVETSVARIEALAGHEKMAFYPYDTGTAFALFSPDGTTIYSGGKDGGLIAWNVAGVRAGWSGAPLVKYDDRAFTAGALSPDGSVLALGWTSEAADKLSIRHLEKGKVLKETEAHVRVLAFAQSGHLLCLLESDGPRVDVWDIERLQLEATLELGTRFAEVFFAPGARYLIGQPADSERLEVWKLY